MEHKYIPMYKIIPKAYRKVDFLDNRTSNILGINENKGSNPIPTSYVYNTP